MAGTVPVSGLDCTVQALQLILLGEQTQSGWRPLADMADCDGPGDGPVAGRRRVEWKDLAPDTQSRTASAPMSTSSRSASYSAVGEEGVAYVIENDTSITKEMVCDRRCCRNRASVPIEDHADSWRR